MPLVDLSQNLQKVFGYAQGLHLEVRRETLREGSGAPVAKHLSWFFFHGERGDWRLQSQKSSPSTIARCYRSPRRISTTDPPKHREHATATEIDKIGHEVMVRPRFSRACDGKATPTPGTWPTKEIFFLV